MNLHSTNESTLTLSSATIIIFYFIDVNSSHSSLHFTGLLRYSSNFAAFCQTQEFHPYSCVMGFTLSNSATSDISFQEVLEPQFSFSFICRALPFQT